MKVTRIPDTLRIQPQQTVCLFLGPPAIGKTEVVEAYAKKIAEEEGLEFINYDEFFRNFIIMKQGDIDYSKKLVLKTFHLTDATDAADLIGMPHVREDIAAYMPWHWIVALCKAKRAVLFLDELTNVQDPNILAASYKLLNERKLGFIQLPPSVQVVAAGNPPEYSSIAVELPTPLASRIEIYEVEAPSVDDWITYMVNRYGSEWDMRIAAYLKAFPDNFIKIPKQPTTLSEYPAPRSWTRLAIRLYNMSKLNINDDMPQVVAEANVGAEVGSHAAAFIKNSIDLDKLLHNPEKFKTLNVEGKWLVISMIANRLTYTKTLSEEIKTFIKNVMVKDAYGEEFFALLISLVPRRLMYDFFKANKELIPLASEVWETFEEYTTYKDND